MTVMERDPAPTAVLERAALLLDAFDSRGPLTLAEITRRAGLPRSSTHRLLEQLLALRWVRRQGNTYELGIRMFEIGSLVRHQHDVRRVALPFLHELHRATGMAVHFGVLDGSDVVYLDRIGARSPARCTTLGKVLLSQAEVVQSRECGTAIEREESAAGVSCVAAPIRAVSGETVAAVSVCGATPSMPVGEVADLVRGAAHGVARRIKQGVVRRASG